MCMCVRERKVEREREYIWSILYEGLRSVSDIFFLILWPYFLPTLFLWDRLSSITLFYKQGKLKGSSALPSTHKYKTLKPEFKLPSLYSFCVLKYLQRNTRSQLLPLLAFKHLCFGINDASMVLIIQNAVRIRAVAQVSSWGGACADITGGPTWCLLLNIFSNKVHYKLGLSIVKIIQLHYLRL